MTPRESQRESRGPDRSNPSANPLPCTPTLGFRKEVTKVLHRVGVDAILFDFTVPTHSRGRRETTCPPWTRRWGKTMCRTDKEGADELVAVSELNPKIRADTDTTTIVHVRHNDVLA